MNLGRKRPLLNKPPWMSRFPRRFAETAQLIPPYVILFVSILATLAFSYSIFRSTVTETNIRFARLARQVDEEIRHRMERYENALRHVHSYFLASQYVSRAEFRTYVESMNLRENFPGIQGVGYTPRIAPAELHMHEQEVRATDFPDYHVWPTNKREDYFSILYLEPMDWRNKRAIGYDMFTDPSRREAMARARDTGLPSASGIVTLVQETSVDTQPGFLVYVPLYAHGTNPQTVEERRESLIGFVYAAFRGGELFNRISRNYTVDRLIDVEVYSGNSPDPENLLYDSNPDSSAAQASGNGLRDSGLYTAKTEVAGRGWIIQVAPLPAYQIGFAKSIPWIVLLAGLLMSGLLFWVSRLAGKYTQRILQSERHLRLITDALPVLVMYEDERGVIRFSNKFYSDQHHHSPQNAVAQSGKQLIDKEAREAMVPHIQSALKGRMSSFESTIHSSELGPRSIRYEILPDIRPDGSIPGVVALGIDVTDDKRVQEQLREEKRAVELVNDVGLSLKSDSDPDHLIKRVTDIACELTHAKYGAFFYYQETSEGRQALALHSASNSPPRMKKQFEDMNHSLLLQKAFRRQGVVKIDDLSSQPGFDRPPSDGRSELAPPSIHSYLAAPVISRSGQTIGALVFGNPHKNAFTDRDTKVVEGIAAQAAVALDNARLYQESQAINRAKDEFLATLSHELRTPLNVILGHAELLRDEPDNKEQVLESIDSIYRNAMNQTQIITDLLDISSVITGKMSFHPKLVSIEDVIEMALESVRFTAESKRIKIDLDILEPDLKVNGDSTRLQQVFWNLLSNAIKFTPREGQITIKVCRENDSCLVSVRDNGQGIDPEFLPYVFDRFRQEDSTMTRRFGGLGLGLSIVRSIAEIHGGSVEARSDGRDQGSEFIVQLPLAVASKSEEISPPSEAKSRSSAEYYQLKNRRILIVDDEPDSRNLLERYIKKDGVETRLAGSAREGFDIFKEFKPDLIVSDIGMPDEDGFSFLRKIRESEKNQGRLTPAIALTAFAGEEDRNKSLAAGFQMHLAKPVGSNDFRNALLSLLTNHLKSKDSEINHELN